MVPEALVPVTMTVAPTARSLYLAVIVVMTTVDEVMDSVYGCPLESVTTS